MKSIYLTDLTCKTFRSMATEKRDDKSRVIKFLRSFSPVSVSGIVTDFQTGEWTKIENLDYELDRFYWSESDIYHFEKYNLKLDDDFIQYVLNRPE